MISAKLQRAYGVNGPASDSERLRRLLLVYDEALSGCMNRDAKAALAAIDGLDGTLDFAACPELALLLKALYQQSREEIRAGKFDAAGRILARLRTSWSNRAGPGAPR